MSNLLTVTKSYLQGTLLTEAQLDSIRTSLQTFVNTTHLNSDNVQSDSIGQGMSSIGANGVASALNSTGALQIVKNIAATSGQLIQVQNSGTAAIISTESQSSSETALAGATVADWTDLANATVTVTARNRPILLMLDTLKTNVTPTSSQSLFIGGNSGNAGLRLVRDGTPLSKFGFNRPDLHSLELAPSSFKWVDLVPGTGSKVYKLQYFSDSQANMFVEQIRLNAVEL